MHRSSHVLATLQIPVRRIALLAVLTGTTSASLLYVLTLRTTHSTLIILIALSVLYAISITFERRVVSIVTQGTAVNVTKGLRWLLNKLRTTNVEVRNSLRVCSLLLTITDTVIQAVYALLSGTCIVFASATALLLFGEAQLFMTAALGVALIIGAGLFRIQTHRRIVTDLTASEQRMFSMLHGLDERRPTIQLLGASGPILDSAATQIDEWRQLRTSYGVSNVVRKGASEFAFSAATLLTFAGLLSRPTSSYITSLFAITLLLAGSSRAFNGWATLRTHRHLIQTVLQSGALVESSRENVTRLSVLQPPTIVLHNVSYTSEGSDILHNISLRINAGEKVAIVGRSGAGKTTLLRVVVGLIRPTDGFVSIDNRPLEDNEIVSAGAMLQNGLLLCPTLHEELSLAAGKQLSFVEAMDLLDKVQLTSRLRDSLYSAISESDLSSGELQRISLIRMLAAACPFQILDEPSSHLDPLSEQTFLRLLSSTAATTVVVAHSLRCVELADKVIVMEDGKITEIGTPRDLLSAPDSRFKSVFG